MVPLVDGLADMLTQAMSQKWSDAKCVVFPSVLERMADKMMDVTAPVITPSYVAAAKMHMTRFKLIISEGSQRPRGPMAICRTLEEGLEVMVVSLSCKPQRVKGMEKIGTVTVA